MLNWSNRFNICCFLDDHNYKQTGNQFDCLLAAGCLDSVQVNDSSAFQALAAFHTKHKDWLFGHLSFELKAVSEGLPSKQLPLIPFPMLQFFVPKYLVHLAKGEITIGSVADDHQLILEAIINENTSQEHEQPVGARITPRQTKADYLRAVEALKGHILRGDCYELNYCQEFYSVLPSVEPIQLFRLLRKVSPAPFSAYYRLNDLYCLSASPERYLQKKGRNIRSQPIKGTRRRMANQQEDEEVVAELMSNEKERAENVMVVDLVRNDISKICSEGTVHVDELFAIYSFPQVHQMISTVSGILADDYNWVDAIAATFPMGSMTGAPKHKVLELIDGYEASARGLYSGAIGYVTPSGDFDFNVVIRSVLYNASTGDVNFHAGSAITFHSDAELEYEECLLKAAFIKQVLEGATT